MANNGYRGEGSSINLTAAAAVTQGSLVQFTNIVGVALNTGVTGDVIPCAIVGEFEIAKVPAAANVFTQGDLVYVTAGGLITNVLTSNKQVGYASAAATTGASTVTVILGA